MWKKIHIILITTVLVSGCASPESTAGKSPVTQEILQENDITSEQLKKLIDTKSDEYLLIDVRSESEYGNGYIPTAVNIPHSEIEDNLNKIPEDKIIIVYCKIGGRASIAAEILRNNGYQKVINFGGIKSYKYKLKR